MQDKTKKILKRSAFATIAAGALVIVFLFLSNANPFMLKTERR